MCTWLTAPCCPSLPVLAAEVGCEKPNRCIFDAALDALNVGSCDAVHVGDDRCALQRTLILYILHSFILFTQMFELLTWGHQLQPVLRAYSAMDACEIPLGRGVAHMEHRPDMDA